MIFLDKAAVCVCMVWNIDLLFLEKERYGLHIWST